MSSSSSQVFSQTLQRMENTPTPLQAVIDPVTDAAGVRLLIKREDTIHPQISGNKWRKLKYNLISAHQNGFTTLLTFGGAYSNHIFAVAAAGKAFGFQTLGIIRGEETLPLNPTLQFARDCGMQIHYVSREAYRQKSSPAFTAGLRQRFGEFYLLPEGGSNALALSGCAEIVTELPSAYDYLCCPCGTGGTLAGLIAGDGGKHKLMGFSVLKGGDFLNAEVNQLLRAYAALQPKPFVPPTNWQIRTEYHFGGYAKVQPELLTFIRQFEERHQIPLEQVYTGKMMYGIYDLIRRGFFRRGETIIAVHTGGLQGRSK
jgi:1-aminocyclopropane-1-carboxylate deaminase